MKMFFPTTDGNVVENLFFMVLFYSFNKFYFILIYFKFMFYVFTHNVMDDYVYEVIRCNEPLVSW